MRARLRSKRWPFRVRGDCAFPVGTAVRMNALLLRIKAVGTRAGARRLCVQACGAKHELRRNVEPLLAAHERAGSFLEREASSALTPSSESLVAKGAPPRARVVFLRNRFSRAAYRWQLERDELHDFGDDTLKSRTCAREPGRTCRAVSAYSGNDGNMNSRRAAALKLVFVLTLATVGALPSPVTHPR